MTRRRPPRLERDPPWMRGPAGDDADAGNDGERLWLKLADGVTPLGKTRHKRHAVPASLEEKAAPAKRAVAETRKPDAAGEGPRPPLPATAKKGAAPPGSLPLTPGRFAGLDRNSGEKLRKGKMAVDAKLDLHGMTQYQAHGAVTAFIRGQQAAGARCVLIVTGKGGKAGDPFAPKPAPARFTMSAGRGVLKEALPQWLNEPGLRGLILAVSPARQQHGGAGAVYVLLKRRR